jgi:hypothetical protein
LVTGMALARNDMNKNPWIGKLELTE